MSWESVFRFAYQKDYIPLMKGLAERIGHDRFIEMITQTGDEIVQRKSASRPPMSFDFAKMVASLKNPPPFIEHTLVAEIVRETPQSFEYKVKQCLWAQTFRESDAGDLGYAIVCHPDFAVAKGLSPKLKLTRKGTLMQGDECCDFRYEMQG